MQDIIVVRDLKRQYSSTVGVLKRRSKRVEALKGISFNVKKGEIFGLLGPNGAGKTTTIKILTTLLAPSSGDAEVLGLKCFGEEKRLRPRINFIFGGERSLYWRLSARDNLKYFADLYKIPLGVRAGRIPELLELVGLADRADEKVETYSKGMKQRLQIARGLINDPEILFLDEPTIGLDPVGARDLRRIIVNLKERGKTILLTTHYMYEADELCDRIGIINKGELIALDTPENLKKLGSGKSVVEVKAQGLAGEEINWVKGISGADNVEIVESDGFQTLQIQCENPTKITGIILGELNAGSVLELNIRRATLEDIYIKLVGEKNAI